MISLSLFLDSYLMISLIVTHCSDDYLMNGDLITLLSWSQGLNLSDRRMLGELEGPGGRASREFRQKFPDEIVTDNLGGQLWFGAECLAAGSSIMNKVRTCKFEG